MMKENKKTLIIASIVTVLPILIGVVFWNRLPDVMATHFGADNEANGHSSKIFAVFGIPLFCLAMLWLAAFITSHDPRKQNKILQYLMGHSDISVALGIYTHLGLMDAKEELSKIAKAQRRAKVVNP